MVGTPSARELPVRVLDSFRHIFRQSDEPTLLAQVAYKSYFEKTVPITKRFETGDMIFSDHSNHEPKNTKERYEQIIEVQNSPEIDRSVSSHLSIPG